MPRSVCHDPTTSWYPQRVVDFAEMELAASRWIYSNLHDERPYHDGTFTRWAKKRTRRHPYHFQDGVSIIVAREDLNPDDEFLTDPRASPTTKRPGGGEDLGHTP